MHTLILKFGGAAAATLESLARIAEIIEKRRSHCNRIVVVISAMGNTTNDLLKLVEQVNPNSPGREIDMLISAGERISIALLAMALHKRGLDALSLTGSQSGIITSHKHTEAKIVDVRPHRILSALQENKIVVVAGFQGMSKQCEITTPGRGGSDITAVALGASLRGFVEFYKDISGVYDKDPHQHPSAILFPKLSYDKAISLTEAGAKVLHPRCVRLAKKNNIPLHVLSFHDALNTGSEPALNSLGTWIRDTETSIIETSCPGLYEEDD